MHEAHPLFWPWTIWTVHGYLNFKRSRIANPCGIYLGGKSSYGKSSIKLFVLDIRIHTHDTHLSSSTRDLQIQAMAKFYQFFYQSRSHTYLSSFPAKNLVPATIQSSPQPDKGTKATVHSRVARMSEKCWLHYYTCASLSTTGEFLPREFHGQRSLVGYSPWGCKESDTTELKHFHTSITTLIRDTVAYDLEGLHLSFVMLHPQHPALCLEYNKNLSLSVVSDSCDPMDCRPPGSKIHGISQARILEWVVIFFTRGSSWPRDWTLGVSCISGRSFIVWATKEARGYNKLSIFIVRSFIHDSTCQMHLKHKPDSIC